MKPFSAPTADILFSLEHVAGASGLPDWDSETARDIIGYFAQFAEAEIAPLDEIGDRQGCRLTDGRVYLPDQFVAAYRSYCEQGWPALSAPAAYDGRALPAALQGAITEIFAGACHSLQMIVGLAPGAIHTLEAFGSQDQCARYIPRLASGEMAATMCLTEADAGSDLAAIRCRAIQTENGWLLDGEKVFISGGDHNLSPSILHLVLARTGTIDEGVRGLSLFACASGLTDGRRNAVSVLRIEDKLGLHASPTCQLRFDKAHAEIIGRPGEGLKAMFTIMNHARLDVALQGVAHAARATDIAKSYATIRLQGKRNGSGPVPLDAHPDVVRMIAEMEALAIGGRALCLSTLVMLDQPDRRHLVEFLTPICKVLCTDGGITAANSAIQVLGGYGYLTEYRIEQTLRDARITSIYEGSNGVHALALATRLLHLENGACANAFSGFVESVADTAALSASLALWQEARIKVTDTRDAAEHAHAFMQLSANLAFQAIWRRIELVADHAIDAERIKALAARINRTAPTTCTYWASLI